VSNPSYEALLAPYLTPEQAALLRYEGTLSAATLAVLGSRLRAELAALATMVPEPLAHDPAALARRSGSFWEGTLLCADLSGFTALAEQLATDGLRGIETLSGLINRVFGALLEELHGHGGVVLKFGGDALTGFFDAGPLGPGHSLAACAAALAMQRRMGEFASLAVGGRSYSLRLRIGIHRGRPFGAILGDEERREVAVTGRAVNQVALLQERAAPGEVLVSAATLAALPEARSEPHQSGRRLLGLPPVTPNPLPPPPPLPVGDDLPTLAGLAARIAELRPFLPATLPRNVLFPDGLAGGEFRPVSALFVNVTSLAGVLALLEEAEPLAAQALACYYGHVQRVIRRYGGEINKLDINSAGDKLLAVFGAPVAHEDDPLRAVEAALDLAPALEEANGEIQALFEGEAALAGASWRRAVDLSLRQRIGVATGSVFAGTVGAPRRREYTVIGQTVNLAARLMAAAEPGAVVVAPATASAVGELIALEPLPPLPLKGFAQPVAAARALGRSAAPAAPARPPTSLVNRVAERELLRDAARSAIGGAGRVVAISGEPGIGKSRLVGAFWEELAGAEIERVALSCGPYAQHTPYSVIRDLLTQLFALPAAPAALAGALDRAVAATAPEFVTLAPLLEAVFPHEGDAPPQEPLPPLPLARMPQGERRERLHDLIVALVAGAVQRRPLAVLIDDLHWADASSLEVVQRLAQPADALPLLLVLSYRPNTLPATPWAELPQTISLPLGGLDPADSLALLAQLLEGLPAEALAPVVERAQGSPLFLEALARHLVDRGIVRRGDGGAWQILRPLTDVSIPSAIEPALAAQLDQLDEATRELVQVAAVIGVGIAFPVLAGVYSQARQPARRLVELVSAGILVADEQEGRSLFRFRQALLRDVAYQGILYTQRRELHRRVAERMEAVFATQLERFAPELAHHYAQAELYDRACAYALRAARASRRRHALPEALAGYGQALELAAQRPDALEPGEALRAREEQADLEVLAGRYEQAYRHYAALLAEAGDGPATLAARAVLSRKVGGIYEQQGLFDEAIAWLHRAQQLMERSQRAPAVRPDAGHLELSRIYGAIGWVHFRRGEPERAQQWLDQALAVLGESGGAGDELLEERARLHNRLGGVAWMLGNLPAARLYVERSLADFSALGDLLGKADAQNNLGILGEQLGDWQAAIASYRAALETNQQSGRRRAAALNRLNLGAAHLQLGELAAARPLLEQAAAQAREVGDAFHENMALRWLGRAYTGLGRHGEAEAALHQALDGARAQQLLLEQLDALTALGELALARAADDDARAAYLEGEALLRRVERATLEVGLFLRFAAWVEERAGAAARGAALRAESQAIFSGLGVAAPPAAPF
jgi:class 3 adenylate cyclase/tetratricopeptide (TPR) repeat protein